MSCDIEERFKPEVEYEARYEEYQVNSGGNQEEHTEVEVVGLVEEYESTTGPGWGSLVLEFDDMGDLECSGYEEGDEEEAYHEELDRLTSSHFLVEMRSYYCNAPEPGTGVERLELIRVNYILK